MGTITDIKSSRPGKATVNTPCYVRVTNRARPGFVEFNFSIGDPTLFLEMILTERAFDEFCKTNRVKYLTQDQEDMVDRHEAVWHDSVAGQGPESDDESENN